MGRQRHQNHLAREKSPYLLQHASNPVDWYPWGEEAFARAVDERKPIFLSIGYSTCHWCHVMEHESFEDERVASVLNRHYISIKVDREERPDIDQIYMKACQAMTGQGGWPLTILMTPEKRPFFAGTYFPREARFGIPGLLDVLEEYARLWQDERARLLEFSEKVSGSIQGHFKPSDKEALSQETLNIAFEEFSLSFDEKHGGFGGAPKFPSPHNLLFLLRYWHSTRKARARDMVERTLSSMHRGGIYDHIGFGFSRYSVDEMWLVPHFEKMLYDNALLAFVYLEAYHATGRSEYAKVAREIFSYVERELRSPQGAFYSAEDADSEGVEGKFYRWSVGEIMGILGEGLGGLACEIFGIDPLAGDEAEVVPNLVGSSFEELARAHGLTPAELLRSYDMIRSRLFSVRQKRVPPFKDDKVLTSWNGLMVAAFSKGAAILGDPHYAAVASGAADFVLAKLMGKDGRLLARYREGEAAHLGYLDDYAFFVWGLLGLYEATFDDKYLKYAILLNARMIDLFWEPQGGGFYLTGRDSEELIARPKEAYDGAIPSGNSVAAMNLLWISRITGDEQVARIAEVQLASFSGDVAQYPSAHAFFLLALMYSMGPTTEVVISGHQEREDFKAMIRVLRSTYLPDSIILFNPPWKKGDELERLAPLLRGKTHIDGKATAFVCKNYACRRPTTDPAELECLLADGPASKK